MTPLEQVARKFLKLRGYYVSKAKSQSDQYVLRSYTKPDGSFDYEKYRSVQEQGNKGKIDLVWADETTIAYIASYLKSVRPHISRGLCHGVRRGKEQRWFSEQLGIEVIGTEISSTAAQFPNTVQWDFHDVNPDWIGAFDFIYTNSHDHAYDPKKALDTWVDQLTDGGMIFLEHTIDQAPQGTSELDPFGVDPLIFPYLILKWGCGNYAVTNVLEPPHTKPAGPKDREPKKIWIFVVSRVRNG